MQPQGPSAGARLDDGCHTCTCPGCHKRHEHLQSRVRAFSDWTSVLPHPRRTQVNCSYNMSCPQAKWDRSVKNGWRHRFGCLLHPGVSADSVVLAIDIMADQPSGGAAYQHIRREMLLAEDTS